MPASKNDVNIWVKRLTGVFTKYVDENPDTFSREDGAYLLLKLDILQELLEYLHQTKKGIVKFDDPYLRVKMFFLLLMEQETINCKFIVFSEQLPANKKTEIISYLLQEYCLCNNISISMFKAHFKKKT